MIQSAFRGKKMWQVLKEGDLVDIVAPASGCSKSTLAKAQKFVEKFGLNVRIPKRIFKEDELCSNSDSKRWEHLKKALLARDSKAIWCLRGGYGSQRLLPKLVKLRPPSTPKLLIGYSDITALHLYMNCVWNWPTLHGSMLEELVTGSPYKKELTAFKNILYGLKREIQFTSLEALNQSARNLKTIRAPLIGGNLTLICSQIGTPWQVNAKGFVLCVEDVGERGYSVDRMLFQLDKSGFLSGARAVIFGEFVGGKEPGGRSLCKDIQKNFAKNTKIPVLAGLLMGHHSKQLPLAFNTTSYLHLGRKPSLCVTTGAF